MSEQETLLATKLYVPRRQPGFVVRPRLVDRLDRGLERGLILVCASNQHIAGELVVTLDTVKKHVSHIFGKLGAANRTEAVARARQLGVLR